MSYKKQSKKTIPIKEALTIHALKLLAHRPHSEYEITRKLTNYLRRKKLHSKISYLPSIISELKKAGYLNDKEFAQWFVNQRQEFRPSSKQRIKKELITKGINHSYIKNALENYDEILACRILAHKKRHMERKKLKAYLYRCGFPYNIIDAIFDSIST